MLTLSPLVFQPCRFRANNVQGVENLCLKAQAGMWPWLSCMCHIRSTAGWQRSCNVTGWGAFFSRKSSKSVELFPAQNLEGFPAQNSGCFRAWAR